MPCGKALWDMVYRDGLPGPVTSTVGVQDGRTPPSGTGGWSLARGSQSMTVRGETGSPLNRK